MIDAAKLAMLKPTAVLINAARGCLVDEAALRCALQEKRLAPRRSTYSRWSRPRTAKLLELPNFLVTPHIGGSAHEAVLAMGRAAIRGLDEKRHS